MVCTSLEIGLLHAADDNEKRIKLPIARDSKRILMW
jgi:hypothetical protein